MVVLQNKVWNSSVSHAEDFYMLDSLLDILFKEEDFLVFSGLVETLVFFGLEEDLYFFFFCLCFQNFFSWSSQWLSLTKQMHLLQVGVSGGLLHVCHLMLQNISSRSDFFFLIKIKIRMTGVGIVQLGKITCFSNRSSGVELLIFSHSWNVLRLDKCKYFP